MLPSSENVLHPLEGCIHPLLSPVFLILFVWQCGISSSVHMTDHLFCPYLFTDLFFCKNQTALQKPWYRSPTITSLFHSLSFSFTPLSSPAAHPLLISLCFLCFLSDFSLSDSPIQNFLKNIFWFLVYSGMSSKTFSFIDPFSTSIIFQAEYHARETERNEKHFEKYIFQVTTSKSPFHSVLPCCCIISSHSCSQDHGGCFELRVDNQLLWTHSEHKKTSLRNKSINLLHIRSTV